MKVPFLKTALQAVLHLVYPICCYGCGKVLLEQEKVLCLTCQEMLPYIPASAAEHETASRFTGRARLQHALSLAHYVKGGLLSYLLEELKYKGRQEVAFFLGKELASLLRSEGWVANVDVISCVPLHPNKQKMRGYNQSALIASTVASFCAKPCLQRLLERVRDTPSQTRRSRLQRAENMQDAFALARGNNVSDKHVLLIDDVLTTGATLESCLQVLQRAGARVSVATIGIAMD